MNANENLNELPSRTYHLPYQCQQKFLRHRMIPAAGPELTSLIYINSEAQNFLQLNGNGIFLIFPIKRNLTAASPAARPDANIIEVNPLHCVYKRERDTRCGINEGER